jgi:hypothetical protein
MNIKSSLNGIATHTTLSYEIRTNISLFEEYLKDCGVLYLSVADEDLSAFIGLVTIYELSTLIQENPYQHYFPIMNTFGNRIGDLHVGFSFQFIHQPQSEHYFSTVKTVHEKSGHRVMRCEENAVNGQRRRLKQCCEHYKVLPSHTSQYMCDIYKSQQTKESQIVPDSLIADILKRGQRLRDAMVRSLLEDDIAVVDEGTDALPSDSSADKICGSFNESRKVFFDDSKVMEFLFGEDVCCINLVIMMFYFVLKLRIKFQFKGL